MLDLKNQKDSFLIKFLTNAFGQAVFFILGVVFIVGFFNIVEDNNKRALQDALVKLDKGSVVPTAFSPSLYSMMSCVFILLWAATCFYLYSYCYKKQDKKVVNDYDVDATEDLKNPE